MKKLISLSIAAIFSMTSFVSASAAKRSGQWARESIDRANTAGILTESQYAGDFTVNITRGELASLAVKAYENVTGIKYTPTSDPFTDTDDRYVVSAFELGLVNGRGNATFAPGEYTTRQEVAKIMLSLKALCTGTQINLPATYSTAFTDFDKLSDWAKPYVAKAVEDGIITGYNDGSFKGRNNVSRQETVTLITRTVWLSSKSKPVITTHTDGHIVNSGSAFSIGVASEGAYNLYIKAYDETSARKFGSYKKGQTATINSGKLKSNSVYRIFAECDGVYSDSITVFTDGYNLKLEVENGGTYGYRTIIWPQIPGIYDYTLKITERRRSYYEGDIPPRETMVYNLGSENTVQIYMNPNRKYFVEVTGGNYGASVNINTEKVYNSDASAISANYPQSQETAKPLMTNITVPVWKIKGGNKVSSTATFTVHSAIAEKVKLVFEEIYEGPQKFPIKDVGGYAWRGGRSEHNGGTAIDINYNENYCIYNNGTTIGAYWKPGEDMYSIDPYGDVINAFEKYGFTWGGDSWRNPRDYMHFSYLGT